MIGKKVLIRSLHAGVFFGTLEKESYEVLGKVVFMSNARRVWRWEGAATLSQLAVDGTSKPDVCLFPVAVPYIEIVDVIEVIPLSDKAINSLENVPIWTV